MAYTFSLISDALHGARVVGFRGTEAISAPFSIRILARVDGHGFDPSACLHEPLALEIGGVASGAHRFAGIVATATIVHVDAAGALVEVELVPPFARLALSKHTRVFTDVSVVQVLTAVFAEEPLLEFDLRLTQAYATREHIAQHRESNLDFVSRWMEREGIFYFFEHTGDRGRLVVADDASALVASRALPVAYRPGVDGGASHGEAFFDLTMKRSIQPGKVALTDYNYRTPAVKVGAEHRIGDTTAAAIVRHGDHVLDPGEAKRYAGLRSEALASRARVYRAAGPVTKLVTGHRFVAEDHPRWGRAELLATRIEHEGAVVDRPADHEAIKHLALPRAHSYQARVTAIPADAPFRPERVTPWPSVPGLVDGTIDGPATSTYAQIDAEGRYKVRLKSDEGDPVDGSNTTWIRMLQPHGGSVEGWHFPQRKGTEVHVAFAYGDPDRPIIVGCAPNPEKPSVVTAANHSQNVIMTGGSNRIEIEDLAGAQRIDTSCPTLDSYLHLGAGGYQFEGNTNGEGWVSTGADLEITVDGAKTEDVLANVTETYKATQTLSVTGPVTEVLATSRHTTTLGPITNAYAGPLVEQVVNPVKEHYQASLATVVAAATTLVSDAARTINVLGAVVEAYGAAQDTEVTGTLTHTVTGAVTETYSATSTRTLGGFYTLICDGEFTVHAAKFEGDIASWNNFDDATKDHLEDLVSDFIGQQIEITGIYTSVVGAKLNIWNSIFERSLGRVDRTGIDLVLAKNDVMKSPLYLRNHPTKKNMKAIGKFKSSLCLLI